MQPGSSGLNYAALAFVLLFMTTELTRLTIRHHLTDVTLFAAMIGADLVLRRVCFGDQECLGTTVVPLSRDKRLGVFGDRILGFLSGTERCLDDLLLDMRGYTAFRREILLAAREIPWGATESYADLARRAGHPGAVRAVGTVMRRNEFPLVIPCHRVIRSTGEVGGFSGSVSGKMVDLKRALLERERL